MTVNYADSDIAVSDLVAAMTDGESFRHPGFFAGYDLVIEVCSQEVDVDNDVNYAVLSIHLDDGVHTSLCGDATLSANVWLGEGGSWLIETAEPTAAPTPSGQLTELAGDTKETTTVPTVSPTSDITLSPTLASVSPQDENYTSVEILAEDNNFVHTTTTTKQKGIRILLIVMVACSAVVVAGFATVWYQALTSTNGKKKQVQEEEPTETDLSDRSEDEDIIIEVRQLPKDSSPVNDYDPEVFW